jgi:hypothetical protein
MKTLNSTIEKPSIWKRFIKRVFWDPLEEQAENLRINILKDIAENIEHIQIETENILIMSTAHIRAETDHRFSQFAFVSGDIPGKSGLPFGLSAMEWGYIIQISLEPDYKPDFEDLRAYDLEEVYHILDLAFKTGCKYIHLDSDGPVYKNLTTYEW